MSSSSERSGSPSQSASGESDSGSDSSDEFFDAEEPTGTLLRFSKKAFEVPKQRIDLTTLTPAEIDSCSSDVFFSPSSTNVSGSGTLLASHNASNASITSLPRTEKELEELAEEERRMKKMEEMRRRLNTEEVEELHPDETSPSDSQTSSIEGLYGATSGRTSHPFKVVDHDTVSMQSGVSVGRLGRITNNPPSMSSVSSTATSTSTNSSLTTSAQTQSTIPTNAQTQQQGSGTANNEDLEVVSTNNANNKPDLVASCLSKDKTVDLTEDNRFTKIPVAPPRRKRKGLLSSQSEEPSVKDEPSTENARTCPGDGSLQKENTPEPLLSAQSRRTATVTAQLQKRYDSASSVCSNNTSPNPPSPTVSIRSVCKDLDKTLEVSTSQKFWVVKAQDEEKTRAKSSGPRVLRRTESLPKDVMAAFDPSGSGSGGHRESNSNSSTLNTSVLSGDGQLSDTGSTCTTIAAGSLPTTAGQQISSMISAMAALEEQKEKDAANEQLNITLRTRTDSGKLLSDLEILEQVTVLNLDTGERIPLSNAEDKIPKCINPLSLHIMRLTSEYVGDPLLLLSKKDRDSDEESIDSKKSSAASQEEGDSAGLGVRKKTAQIRRFLGSTVKKTVDKAKSLAHHRHAKEDVDISTNEDITVGGQDPLVKMKASHSHKGPYDFDHLQQVQDLMGEHNGPVWCMKFSNDGRLLATAGQDRTIRIWVLKDHLPYFQDMRSKHTVDKVSPTPSQESIVSQHSHHSVEEMMQACENSDPKAPFVPRPLCIYSGHTADLLDIAWSKSFFLLSSSMDRTVRLWHISRRECLCCFQHIDFVTAIAFHPRDDRYFLSGSLDGKLRLWNIPDKKVALWNEVNGPNNLITTANFCQNGKFAVVGTYDGRCIFFHTEQLKYHTQIIVHRRKRLTGRKITGIEPMPGEDKILVTSNDSRIRLYDLRDLSLTCKYKGYTNSSSQIKGTVSHDGKYIVSGSENQCVYIWKTCHDYSKFSSARRDRNGYWEGIKAHNAVVTCAIFAPDPDIIVRQIEAKEREAEKQQRSSAVKSPSLTKSQSQTHASACPLGYVLVSADFSGCIKVFLSKVKPKHSSLPASALA